MKLRVFAILVALMVLATPVVAQETERLELPVTSFRHLDQGGLGWALKTLRRYFDAHGTKGMREASEHLRIWGVSHVTIGPCGIRSGDAQEYCYISVSSYAGAYSFPVEISREDYERFSGRSLWYNVGAPAIESEIAKRLRVYRGVDFAPTFTVGPLGVARGFGDSGVNRTFGLLIAPQVFFWQDGRGEILLGGLGLSVAVEETQSGNGATIVLQVSPAAFKIFDKLYFSPGYARVKKDNFYQRTSANTVYAQFTVCVLGCR